MKARPKVYVTSRPSGLRANRDFSAADNFGNIQFVLQQYPSPSYTPDESLAEARAVLQDFDYMQDSIVFGGGDPFSVLVVTTALIEMGVPWVQVLRWERKLDATGNRSGGFYLPIRQPLAETEPENVA